MFGTHAPWILAVTAIVGPFSAQDPVPIQIDIGRWQADQAFYRGLADGLIGELPGPGLEREVERLILADVGPPGGVGDDATLRAFVARFLAEESPWHLYLLAQHLRLQTTRRWGTIWTIEGEPLERLAACAAGDPDPARRAFALIALRDRHDFRSAPYLADAAPLVRLAAARCLAAPAGATEAEAQVVVDALLSLLADERPVYRTAGAGALGAWVFRASDLARLEDAATSDPDPGVRAAALEVLGETHSLRARERLRKVVLDPESAPSARDAALRGLARTGIVP